MQACHFFFTTSLRIMSKSFSSPRIAPKGPELTVPALLWSTEGMGHCWSLIKTKSPLTIKFLTFYSSRSFSSNWRLNSSIDAWIVVLFDILCHLGGTCLHWSSHWPLDPREMGPGSYLITTRTLSVVVKYRDSGVRDSKIRSWPCWLLATWPGANNLTLQCLIFLIHSRGILVPTHQSYCVNKDWMSKALGTVPGTE